MSVAGTYVHDRDENLSEFMESRGRNFLQCKLMSRMSPTVTITDEGDESYVIKTKTSMQREPMEWSFKLGEEAECQTPEGPKTFTFTMEDDKLVQVPVNDDQAQGFKIIREFSDEGMKMTFLHEDSGDSATRYFKRQE